MVATAVSAVLCLLFCYVSIWPATQAENFVRNAPIQTIAEPRDDGSVSSRRITYCMGRYGVTEFGNIRLAIRGCTFTGESSGGLSLANNSKIGGGGGSTGVGNRRFTSRGIPGGTSCTFGGFSFDITHGRLKLLGKTIDVAGPPQVVIIDESGQVESVTKIGPQQNEVEELADARANWK